MPPRMIATVEDVDKIWQELDNDDISTERLIETAIQELRARGFQISHDEFIDKLELSTHDKKEEAFVAGLKIGDGTAPAGWPAYGKHGDGIICNYNQCGHTGSLGAPARMTCAGFQCACSCCQFLAGATVHGCAYGRRPEGKP